MSTLTLKGRGQTCAVNLCSCRGRWETLPYLGTVLKGIRGIRYCGAIVASKRGRRDRTEPAGRHRTPTRLPTEPNLNMYGRCDCFVVWPLPRCRTRPNKISTQSPVYNGAIRKTDMKTDMEIHLWPVTSGRLSFDKADATGRCCRAGLGGWTRCPTSAAQARTTSSDRHGSAARKKDGGKLEWVGNTGVGDVQVG